MSAVGDGFDFNHDGRLDALESAFMNDTLFLIIDDSRLRRQRSGK